MIVAVAVVGALAAPTLDFGVKGARMSISDPRSQRVPFFFRNRTRQPVVVWVTTFFANRMVYLTDEEGRAVPMTPLGERQGTDFRLGRTARDKNAPYTIRPGELLRDGTPPLGESYALRTGTYRMVVEYWERSEKPHLRVRSAPLAVTVVP